MTSQNPGKGISMLGETKFDRFQDEKGQYL